MTTTHPLHDTKPSSRAVFRHTAAPARRLTWLIWSLGIAIAVTALAAFLLTR